MIDSKRIAYLLSLALLIGLVQVQFRTAHMQSVYQITRSAQQECQLKQALEEQLAQWSACMESPQRVKEQVLALGLDIVPPSIERPEETGQQWVMNIFNAPPR